MYDGEEEQTIDFKFKALSSDPWLQDDVVFFAVDGPEEMLTQGFPLPGVAGLMPITEEHPEPRQFHLKGLKEIHYNEIKRSVLETIPGKFEEWATHELQKQKKKQNPGSDKERATPTPREFKEIRGQKDFKDVCKSHKACAIGILPAITTIDYELAGFKEK